MLEVEGIGVDSRLKVVNREEKGRIKNDFQVLSFNMWSLVVVFIEIGKRSKNRCQKTIKCSVLNV